MRNDSGIYGVTYRWGSSLDNADLVPEEGMDEIFSIDEGGSTRNQTWHYPSRNECLQCHLSNAGFSEMGEKLQGIGIYVQPLGR